MTSPSAQTSAQILLNLKGDTTDGYTTSFNVGLDLTDTAVGASDINTGGPGGLGGPGGPGAGSPHPPTATPQVFHIIGYRKPVH